MYRDGEVDEYDEESVGEGYEDEDEDEDNDGRIHARDDRNRRVSRGGFQFREAMQDSMLGLKRSWLCVSRICQRVRLMNSARSASFWNWPL